MITYPFGWHVGGWCEGACGYPGNHNHDVPEGMRLVFGPDDGEDGLPTFEYLAKEPQVQWPDVPPGARYKEVFNTGWIDCSPKGASENPAH